MIFSVTKKERRLGVAREKRRYDLPLGKAGGGAGFLVLLIALMTFLAMLALCASFALSALADRWTAGLENQATVEIPAQNPGGKILSPEEIRKILIQAESILRSDPAVTAAAALSAVETAELVRPWLGDDLLSADIPLPGLVSVTLENTAPETMERLENRIRTLHKSARIDRHEEWLGDLLRFTGAMNLFSLALLLVIGATTVTAVAGAIQSRMAVHHAEVELLHLMGAHDRYIARQFQRYALRLSFRGALYGIMAGVAVLALMGWAAGGVNAGILPEYRIGYGQAVLLAALPVLMALTALATARHTVLKTLSGMP